MDSHYFGYNLLSDEQKLLLQAAFWQGEAAIDSWQKWRTSVNIDDIDNDSYRLLPLVYRNLSAHNVSDSYLGRLKGVYRRTWVENQVFFQQIASILPSFQEAGIKTLLLKDAALNLHYYQDYGLRTINNLDLLIRPTDVLKAITLLQNLNWITKVKIPDSTISFTHIIGLENESKQYLNLRWHLFGDGFGDNVENDFWQGAILTKVSEIPVYVLCPTDQLFYTCVFRGLRNSISPIIRLIDAAIVIQSYPSEINWSRLIAQAQKYRFVLPLKTTLLKLSEILNVSIPLSILEEIRKLSVSEFERQEYQIFSSENLSVLNRLKMRYFQYSRIVNPAQFKFLDFLSYLQYIWGLENLWQVPLQATIRGIRRLRSQAKRI